ncbi:MAG: class I SAM-dependent RNA methyltransferase [Ignavibacteria bacterium]|jgi:tRNA/tmRNA/rRNA uracil-C5-methylase (TrmA/RlmC/RlmD family)|nr:class I SAM-dependent RNA methyltransferase [Ignavibacteria bacterium]MCU7501877.1 class I SAM-dependent RNA methyltransferase [Ignavibacteria bacterium]MCU7514777.1 class I SAM-dependent RNA methyltransferase [Ignavibacteria bacterium]
MKRNYNRPSGTERPHRIGKQDKTEKFNAPDKSGRPVKKNREENNFRPASLRVKKDSPIKAEEAGAGSFSGILLRSIPREVKKDDIEPLSAMDYEAELRLKNDAFAEFWQLNRLPLKPEAIRRSPKARHYRTTTKRRVVNLKGRFHLFFSESHRPSGENLFSYSELEPEEHNAIYKFLLDKINEPAFRLIGFNLNYLIIRGSYTEFTVIFNVHTLNAEIVRKLRALSLQMQKLEVNIASSFIYLDPTRSEYYLENLRPKDQMNFKKLFGADKIFLMVNGKKYSFHPTSFSQVNLSMVPVMLDLAKEMLSVPEKDARFIDLFCGYGLFTHFLADSFSEATGIEAEGASVKSAIENTPYFSHKGRVRFLAHKIESQTLEDSLPQDGKPEVFLLDPPRQGTATGVIKSVTERNPLKVIHIFCGVDEIPRELKLWTKNGYRLKRVVPLDMFPGTPNLEVMLLFNPE